MTAYNFDCPEHGRVRAYVWRQKGNFKPDGIHRYPIRTRRACIFCRRLNAKTWYLFGGGKAKMKVSGARWELAHRAERYAKHALYMRERRQRERMAIESLVS